MPLSLDISDSQQCKEYNAYGTFIVPGEYVRHSRRHLKLVPLDHSLLDVALDLPEDGQHGNVGLPGSRGRTDEEVFIGVVRRLKDNGLDAVE